MLQFTCGCERPRSIGQFLPRPCDDGVAIGRDEFVEHQFALPYLEVGFTAPRSMAALSVVASFRAIFFTTSRGTCSKCVCGFSSASFDLVIHEQYWDARDTGDLLWNAGRFVSPRLWCSTSGPLPDAHESASRRRWRTLCRCLMSRAYTFDTVYRSIRLRHVRLTITRAGRAGDGRSEQENTDELQGNGAG
jgi:hypothetical protein